MKHRPSGPANVLRRPIETTRLLRSFPTNTQASEIAAVEDLCACSYRAQYSRMD